MDRNSLNMVNLCLNAVNCLTMIVIFILTIRKVDKTSNRRSFFVLLVTIFIFNVSDSITWICEGTSPAWKIPVLHLGHFTYYVASPVIYISFVRFIRGILKDNDLNNRFYIACICLCLISIVNSYLSCYPGLLYTITPDNIYVRSRYHMVGVVCTFSFYLMCICYIVSNRTLMNKRTFLAVLSFPSFPMLFYIPQVLFYGIATVNLGLTLSVILLYMCLKNRMRLEVRQKINFSSEYFKKKDRVPFVEKIRRFAFSYGFSANSIASIEDELQGNINDTLKVVFGSSGLLTALCFIGSFFSARLSQQRAVYLVTTLLCTSFFMLFLLAKNRKSLLKTAGYLFFIMLFVVNIYKSLAITPEQSPILFICVLCMAPSLFCYMPYIIWFIDLSAVFIYMDLARIYKTAESVSHDSVFLFVLTFLGIIIGYNISKTKITSIYLTKNLDNEVAVKTKQLNAMSKEIVTTLTSSIESKDEYTNGHSGRVADYAVMLAVKTGWTEEACDELWMEAILHDVGKIGVPDSILKKTGRLTAEEFKIIQSHTTEGAKILENLASFPKAKEAANFHHERINGKGYPEGLRGDDIPEAAKIVAIADAYDAMTSCRCYRPALSDDAVLSELINGRGTQFDAELLDEFLELLDDHGGSLLARD